MIKLYGFGASFGLVDPSPFVLKVDLYLRMAEIEFELIGDVANLQKAPKAKLPFIDDDGLLVPDSFFIIQYLKDKYEDRLDGWLSDEQKAQSHLIMRSIDEDVYWCLVYSRWVKDDTWPIIKNTFFGGMPFPLNKIVPLIARRGVKKTLVLQGLSKHKDDEIKVLLAKNLDALSTLLSDKSYFFGDKACTLDVVIFSFLAQLILVSIDNPFNELAKGYGNLVRYCQRIHSEYYA